MSSNIIPGNIDGTYPKAGQDNSSQGFRDNFTEIKNNYTTAASEITALQTNKASLDASNDFFLTPNIEVGKKVKNFPKIDPNSENQIVKIYFNFVKKLSEVLANQNPNYPPKGLYFFSKPFSII